jgi:alpha/beta superfamily hydrolase
MGNASSGGGGKAAPVNEPATPDRVKAQNSSKRSTRSATFATNMAPLHVVKDNSSQTSLAKKQGHCNLVCVLLALAILYLGLCLAAIFSAQAQGFVVYSNAVKDSKRDLTNLLKMDLPMGKNIQISTEDGVELFGYHVMPPGVQLLAANRLNDTQRDTYFDQTLATAPRVVIYFHGNSATRGQAMRVSKIKQLSIYLHAHVLTFDYRGFADSTGSPSEAGTLLDSRAVVRYLDGIVRRYNPKYTGYLADKDASAGASAGVGAGAGAGVGAGVGVGVGLDVGVGGSDAEAVLASLGVSGMAHVFEAATGVGVDVGVGVNVGVDVGAGAGVGVGVGVGAGVDVDVGACVGMGMGANNAQPHLYLYGHSLGSAIATALAVELHQTMPSLLGGLVLDAPFTTMPEAARGHPLSAPFRIFPLIFNAM